MWSRRTRGHIEPTKDAVPITEEARAQQGIAHKEVVEAVTEVVERKEAEGAADPDRTIRLCEGEEIRASGGTAAEDCEEPGEVVPGGRDETRRGDGPDGG